MTSSPPETLRTYGQFTKRERCLGIAPDTGKSGPERYERSGQEKENEMQGKIMVPLDGSELAERAVPYAASLASALQRQVALTRVAIPQFAYRQNPLEEQKLSIREAEAYLRGVAARPELADVSRSTSAPYGTVVEKLVEEILLEDIGLVVMSTHGRSGLARWMYGSVAEYLLSQAPVPVILLRSWQENNHEAALPANPRILVPLNGTKFAERALPSAVSMAKALSGELVLVRVVPEPEDVRRDNDGRVIAYVDEQLSELKNNAQRYLEYLALELKAQGCTVRTDVVVGPRATAIVAASRRYNAQLVVMSSHGRTGFERFRLGSVAMEVLQRGDTPLMLINPSTIADGSGLSEPATSIERTSQRRRILTAAESA